MLHQAVAVIDGLDTRTIAFVVSAVFFAVTGLLIFVFLTRKIYAGFGFWVGWQICALLGLLLFFSRGAQPGLASILLNNLLFLLGPALLFHGFVRFFALHRTPLPVIAVYLVVAVAVAVQAYFTAVDPDQNTRIAVFFTTRAFLLLCCAIEPMRKPAVRASASYWLIFVIAVLLAGNDLVQVWRGLNVGSEAEMFASFNIKTVLIIAVISDVLAAYGLLLLTGERLETELRTARYDIEQLARTDALTGIWNRRHFEDIIGHEVERARRYGQPLSLVLFDIDRFKSVNDRFGHATGDAVLRKIAKLGRQSVRASDVIGRWGGEEFFVLAPSTALGDARSLAEKLRRAIGSYEFVDISPVTASFGTAQWRENEDVTAWVRRADAALYAAKQDGRNRVEAAP